MKKKNKILAGLFAGACILGGFALTGCLDVKADIDFRVENGYVQWTDDGETWKDLVSLEDIKGDDGIGVDGKEVEFRRTETHIQWRYVGDDEWTDLVALEDIKGDEGEKGEDASYLTYTVNYEYGCIPTLAEKFKNYKTSQEVKSYEWITGIPALEEGDYEDDFLGWYIKGTDRQVKEYDFIGGNVTLEAKWNMESDETVARLCKGVNVVYEDETYVAYILNEEEIIVPKYYDDGQNGEKIVTIIDSEGYYYDSNVTKVLLQEGVTTILPSAFSGCKIKSLVIPASITKIYSNSFAKCSELLEIVVDSNNEVYDSRNNCNAIVETSTNKIILGCKNTVIVDTITTIGESAFSYSKIDTLNIPSGVTEIELRAFYSCSYLYNVYIPKTVLKIGWDAFVQQENPHYLSNIAIACEVEKKPDEWEDFCETSLDIVWNARQQVKNENYIYTITKDSKVVVQLANIQDESLDMSKLETYEDVKIGQYAFAYEQKLKNIIFPNNLTEISSQAFYNCKNIIDINLWDCSSLESIGDDAFRLCSSLHSVYLPSSLKTIGSAAFYYESCSILYLYIDANSKLEDIAPYNSGYRVLCCRDGGNEYIQSLAWSSNVILNCKEIVDGEEYIYAILNNNTVHIIDYKGDSEKIVVNSSIDGMPIVNLSSSTFPLTNIIEVDLSNCLYLTQVPENLFSRSSVEVVKLPNSIETIRSRAFNSSNIKSIILPSGLKTIEISAFANVLLSSIVIPDSVTCIENNSFSDYLNDIYFLGTKEKWDLIEKESPGWDNEAEIYFYIENEENVPDDGGNYWHYDTDGITPIVW